MTYLDDLADLIRGFVPPDLIPDENTEKLFQLYALLGRSKGSQVQAPDVHDAWVLWMQDLNPHHKALRRFEELDADTKAADEPYVEAIRRAVAEGSSE